MLPWILCGFLSITVIILLFKIKLLQTSMQEICTEFKEILSKDTNMLITISSTDKTVQKLATTINIELAKLRKMRHQYENSNLELKEAVTNISHDLRTPLTAIWGYLDLLERKNLEEDILRYIKQIRNRSLALKHLIDELFRYSLITSIEELSVEKVNLGRILEETLISFEGAFCQANISPEIQIPAEAVWRNLDSTALTRILENLLNNVLKYSDGNCKVILETDGRIIFSNTAKKLSTVDVCKLFDRFFTIDSAKKSTGLGLSIAKLLVERMNGKITADYENQNLIITITFY